MTMQDWNYRSMSGDTQADGFYDLFLRLVCASVPATALVGINHNCGSFMWRDAGSGRLADLSVWD